MRRSLALGFGFALVASIIGSSSPVHAQCVSPDWPETIYVSGRYTNIAAGDVIVYRLNATSIIAPVINGLGEGYSHVAMMQNTGTRISTSLGNPAYGGQGFSQSHPFNPNYLPVLFPGVMNTLPPDVLDPAFILPEGRGYGDQFYNGMVSGTDGSMVMKAASNRGGCPVIPPTTASAYRLYAYSHNSATSNGNCVDFQTDSCGVARPTPTAYSAATIYNAASAMFNAIYSTCRAHTGSWAPNFPGFSSDVSICNRASNQVINTMLYNDPWNADFANWSVAVTDSVTPQRLLTAYAGTKVVATTVQGYYSVTGKCCHYRSAHGDGGIICR